MSVADFQRALCDMTLNPVLAASVMRRGASPLKSYELSALELERLVAVVRQAGMSVNCTLARANRFGPIADAFPLTCSLLKPRLRGLLDELWNSHQPGNYQLNQEADAFASFLERKIARGELEEPYARDIFAYECAARELIETLRSSPESGIDPAVVKSARVRFRHDPRVLLPYLERDEAPPAGLPAGEYRVCLTLTGDTLEAGLEDAA